jgi:hypothetical protein
MGGLLAINGPNKRKGTKYYPTLEGDFAPEVFLMYAGRRDLP